MRTNKKWIHSVDGGVFEHVECTLIFVTDTVYDMYIFTICIYIYLLLEHMNFHYI